MYHVIPIHLSNLHSSIIFMNSPLISYYVPIVTFLGLSYSIKLQNSFVFETPATLGLLRAGTLYFYLYASHIVSINKCF